MKDGLTFDTGALIALERRGQRARKVLERATEQKVRITALTLLSCRARGQHRLAALGTYRSGGRAFSAFLP